MDRQDTPFDRILSDFLKENTPKIPDASYRLESVKVRIAAQGAKQNGSGVATVSPRKTLLSKWKAFFGLDSPRAAFAMGLIGLQFAAVSGLALHIFSGNGPYSEARSTSTPASPVAVTKYLRVSFKSSATEGEIRKLLNAVQGDIVAGPSQIGEYFILTSNGIVEEKKAMFSAASVVESIEIVSKLP